MKPIADLSVQEVVQLAQRKVEERARDHQVMVIVEFLEAQKRLLSEIEDGLRKLKDMDELIARFSAGDWTAIK